MACPPRPTSSYSFTIAILCALTLEADAVEALFDVCWDDEDGPPFEKAPNDHNTYSTGAIGRHNVVLAHVSGMGTASAASIASHCKSSFPNIKLGLVVGICGVVPFSAEGEIILGDVIVSDGVVQYDSGRQLPGQFERKNTLRDNLERPNPMIQSKLKKLKGLRSRKKISSQLVKHLSTLQQEPLLSAGYPGKAHDRLFEATYRHVDRYRTCEDIGCDGSLVQRQRLDDDQSVPAPFVHFGLFLSGNLVMKFGEDRDSIANKEGIIAFEMESAGVWDSFPCVVIKGACDYADGHKNKRWQRYAAATAAACMKGILAGWEPFQEPTQQQPVSYFIVPYPRNKGFVGRPSIQQALESQLGFSSDDGTESRRRVSLYGLGGVGKTQIALSYVYWLHDTHPHVSIFWIHASNAERFQEGYLSIAEFCEIPGRHDTEADLFQLVKTWLEKRYQGRWLMVIDNADDMELFFTTQHQGGANASLPEEGHGNLSRYLPQCTHGSILLTSRNRQAAIRFSEGKPSIEVREMTDEEAGQLVRTQMRGYTVSQASVANLSTRLEQLPLALAQATSFMVKNSVTIDDYIRLLDESDSTLIDLLSEPFQTVGRRYDTPHAVAATWIITFAQMERQNGLASSFLSMASLLDCQAIPEKFLHDYVRRQRPVLVERGSESSEAKKALGVLQAYSFISRGAGNTVDIHRLVQMVTRKWLVMRGKLENFARDALMVVSNAYPYGRFETHKMCLQYLPHAFSVLDIDFIRDTDAELARSSLLDNISGLFLFQGQWWKAEEMLIQAIPKREEVLGEEHPDTLRSKSNLALTYQHQGRWKEAESLQAQVMEARQRTLGKEHPDTLTSMGILASTYRNQGRWEEAESIEVEVMETTQRLLGMDHIVTVTTMGNLASTYRNQGRWDEAESLDMQVLEARQRVLGEEHPDTLSSMGNLASTYRNQGRWEEAESIEVPVMETTQRQLGMDHPVTLTTMGNLALTYRNQGRWDEAESLDMQVLEARQRVLGEEHPDTLSSMGNLASIYRHQGRQNEAESLYLQILDRRRRVLGEEHPDTLTTMGNLASIYQDQGRWKEAESLDTLSSLDIQASSYQIQGQYHEEALIQTQNMNSSQARMAHQQQPGESTNVAYLTPDAMNMESEQDSGYASVTRKTAQTTQPEESIRETMPIIDEIESLASDIDDIGSQASEVTTQEAMTGKALIRVFLQEDVLFRSLCERAMSMMSKMRFVKNMTRLLRYFHQNLLQEARSESEKAVAQLLRSERGRIRISEQLAAYIQQENDCTPDNRDESLQVSSESVFRLEKWLGVASLRPAIDEGNSPSPTQSSSSDSDTSDWDSHHTYISQLKLFLSASRSLQTLQRDLMLLFLPSNFRHVLNTVPKRDIWLSRAQDSSILNGVKAWIEDHTNVEWDWWPLQPRKRTLQDNEGRITWLCACGRKQWEEVSSERYELLNQILVLSDDRPQVIRRCGARPSSLSHWLGGIVRQFPAALSAAAQRYMPAGNPVPPSSVVSSSQHQSVNQPYNRDPSRPAPYNQFSQQSMAGAAVQPKSWILFGVQRSWGALIPAQIPVSDDTSDYDVVQNIKECYRLNRGRLRSWFSVWKLDHCEVVKFIRREYGLVHDYKELPEHQDYEYSPRAGSSDARNPPLPSHAFEELSYSCRSPCTRWVPHRCVPCSADVFWLGRIPKRTKCFDKDRTGTCWGFEAVSSVSAIHVALYHIIIFAGPFAFWIWWLGSHSDDLQNASVPATVVLSGLSLFWSVAGILTHRTRS